MDKNKEFGVLYVAAGKRHIQEAVRSASSAQRMMPDIPIAIWVDDPRLLPPGIFDIVSTIENQEHSFLDKILPLLQTPFLKTLFLDTDTLLIEPVYELILLLDRFDLACCHAPWRRGHHHLNMSEFCPESFPEFNSGVILYKRNQTVMQFLRSWAQIYKEQLSRDFNAGDQPEYRKAVYSSFLNFKMTDQPAFREALYLSSLNFTILPPEYNFRTVFPGFAGGNMKVKILHGREPSLSRAIKKVNKNLGVRIADYSQPGLGRGFLDKIKKLRWR